MMAQNAEPFFSFKPPHAKSQSRNPNEEYRNEKEETQIKSEVVGKLGTGRESKAWRISISQNRKNPA